MPINKQLSHSEYGISPISNFTISWYFAIEYVSGSDFLKKLNKIPRWLFSSSVLFIPEQATLEQRNDQHLDR